MRRICVFCGSNKGVRPEYLQAARAFGQRLVACEYGLVYGGASVGLMGVVADSVLEAGGEVIGVIPRSLFRREIAHRGLTKLHEVESMHERKALMANLADGFVALPGGFGTFDELFEIITWAQLGLHSKPVGLLNISNFFAPLLALVRHATEEGFISSIHASLLLCESDPAALLERLIAYAPQAAPSKWTELPPQP